MTSLAVIWMTPCLVSAPRLAARIRCPNAGDGFDVATAHLILELAGRRRERIACRRVDVAAVFAVDHDLRPRQCDDQPHRDLRAFRLLPLLRLGDHLATADAVANAVQPACLFADEAFERARSRDAAQRDIYGVGHCPG